MSPGTKSGLFAKIYILNIRFDYNGSLRGGFVFFVWTSLIWKQTVYPRWTLDHYTECVYRSAFFCHLVALCTCPCVSASKTMPHNLGCILPLIFPARTAVVDKSPLYQPHHFDTPRVLIRFSPESPIKSNNSSRGCWIKKSERPGQSGTGSLHLSSLVSPSLLFLVSYWCVIGCNDGIVRPLGVNHRLLFSVVVISPWMIPLWCYQLAVAFVRKELVQKKKNDRYCRIKPQQIAVMPWIESRFVSCFWNWKPQEQIWILFAPGLGCIRARGNVCMTFVSFAIFPANAEVIRTVWEESGEGRCMEDGAWRENEMKGFFHRNPAH